MSLRDAPIQRKLTVIILVTSGAVLVSTSVSYLLHGFHVFRQTMVRQVSALGDIISANSTAALAFDNQTDATELLAALKAESHVKAAVLYDQAGRLFAKYPAEVPEPRLGTASERPGYKFQSLVISGFQPVVQGNRRLGTLYLQFDTGDIVRQWMWNSLAVAVAVIAMALSIVALISHALRKQILRPILSLAGTANTISTRGEYSLRAVKYGQDEIGQLTDQFNRMLAGIQAREQALRDENAERRWAEEALRQSEAQLKTVVDNIAEGVVVSDLTGRVLHFNRAAIAQHGYTSLEQCQRRLPEFADTFRLATLDGTILPMDQWPLARVLRGEELRDVEICVRRHASDWQRIFSYGGTLVHDAKGQPLLAVVTVRDITERIRAEQDIRALNAGLEQRVRERTAQLEAANKELEAFSYSVSHDLRAPLRHIDGYVQMLTKHAGETLSDKSRRYLKIVSDSVEEMGRLIDDLLAFSRMGRVEMLRMPVELNLLLQDVLASLQSETAHRHIRWKVEPLPTVEGDPSMLKQVFVNLLSNAVKYTRQREQAEIEVGIASETADEVTALVRDNGAGFDMKYAHKLFGVFQRLHRSDEFEGTGVGLASVRRIIHRHGGRIWAESAVGAGATFYFTMKKAKEI